MDMNMRNRVTLPAGRPEFVIARVFDAPRSLVWQCWMDPAHLAHWWGPQGFTCPVCEVDPRAGGAFRLVMRAPDGRDYPMRGVFREIVPEMRIVKEDDTSEHSAEWHDMVDPDRKGQGQRKIPMLTTVSFADEGKGTRVTNVTVFPSISLRDNFARAGMAEGWSSSLDKLADLADALKDAPHEINMRRRIAAPLATVFAAFSDPRGLAVWWGPNGFTTTTRKLEFRVGGEWDYTMHGPDGTDYPNFVRYTAIVPNARIAYDHGTIAAEPPWFKAEITFAGLGEATDVHLRLILPDAAQRPGYVGFGAVEGGYQNLARLEAYLASRKAEHRA
jgi:uncharacterized protein YndB with AHSA1/START domain